MSPPRDCHANLCIYVAAPYFVKKLPHEEIINEGDSLEIECRVTEAAHEDVNANIDIKLEGTDVSEINKYLPTKFGSHNTIYK